MIINVPLTPTPVLDLRQLATDTEATGKYETECWLEVPETKRNTVLEFLRKKDRLIAAEAVIDGKELPAEVPQEGGTAPDVRSHGGRKRGKRRSDSRS